MKASPVVFDAAAQHEIADDFNSQEYTYVSKNTIPGSPRSFLDTNEYINDRNGTKLLGELPILSQHPDGQNHVVTTGLNSHAIANGGKDFSSQSLASFACAVEDSAEGHEHAMLVLSLFSKHGSAVWAAKALH